VLRLVQGQTRLTKHSATHIARFRVVLAQLSPAARALVSGGSWAGKTDCICQIPYFYDFAVN